MLVPTVNAGPSCWQHLFQSLICNYTFPGSCLLIFNNQAASLFWQPLKPLIASCLNLAVSEAGTTLGLSIKSLYPDSGASRRSLREGGRNTYWLEAPGWPYHQGRLGIGSSWFHHPTPPLLPREAVPASAFVGGEERGKCHWDLP